MNLPDAPVPTDGFFVTHVLTVSNQRRSRDFYAGILGGEVWQMLRPATSDGRPKVQSS